MSKSRIALAAALVVTSLSGATFAVEVLLKDGRILTGGRGQTGGVAERPRDDQPQTIWFIDDNVRRTFFPMRLAREIREEPGSGPIEKFHLWQRVLEGGRTVASVGPRLNAEPFDEWGRRTYAMQTSTGREDVVQGITELTPRWVKVEGITHTWDMRISPQTIATPDLLAMLNHGDDANTVEHQKKIARLLVQMERYEDALVVLQKLLKEHGGNAEERKQIDQSLQQLRQVSAQRMLNELKRRRDAGQHAMVDRMLKAFPTEQVAGEILQEVRELIDQNQRRAAQRKAVAVKFAELTGRINDVARRAQLDKIGKEIAEELGPETLGRMAAFRLAQDDNDLLPAERVSLAVTGWLLGSDAASPNLGLALSAWQVRDMIHEYLISEIPVERQKILQKLASQEAATPKMVALLLAHMKPPKPTTPVEGKPGFFRLEVPGLDKEPPVPYVVQLPPEYDPYRRYPTVITLHASGVPIEQQLEWWAGPWQKDGTRLGYASRNGYIIVAPDWTVPHQTEYDYSARAHAAVLHVLRDACRRFSIDTDRVFLSGHAMGGDAAWDLGLAHPDLWAGVIPIVARSGRYCRYYWKNAKRMPFYFVGGEKDGHWIQGNAVDLDNYLIGGFNTTVVEYQGRGHEHYFEEIQRIFEWMGRFRRDFFPREFSCVTMRPWDNFFWWVEVEGLMAKALVYPLSWPPPRSVRAMPVEGTLKATNGMTIRTGAAKVTVWLAPEIVDFDKRIEIDVNGRWINSKEPFIKPNLEVLLEDARTRADRQHPFWAKAEATFGRR
ncbi:MAG: peptidase [Pirellulales bacterium]|nr:peptidase [Pirellulales bacterium]